MTTESSLDRSLESQIVAVCLPKEWQSTSPFLADLPEAVSSKLMRLKLPDDRWRSLLGELLIRVHACQRMGLRDCDLMFAHQTHKKPFLTNVPKLRYNISHSGKWVVCYLSSVDVGIDIEKHISIDLVSVAKACFTDQELDRLLRENPQERISLFYDIWTRKESFVKALGSGLTTPLKLFRVDQDFVEHDPGILSTSIDTKYLIRSYQLDHGYSCAACAPEHEKFPQHIRVMEAKELIERYYAISF